MINILFSDSCRTAFWGGVEKWITTLGEELNKQNYNVHLICRPHSLLGERAQSVGLAVHHATFKNSLDITTTLKILSLIRKQKNKRYYLCQELRYKTCRACRKNSRHSRHLPTRARNHTG